MDMLIKCNVGIRERQVRFAAGVAAVVGAYVTPNPVMKSILGVLGLFGLSTGATRYCPVNQMLGVRHCQPAYRSVRQLIRRI
jgi:hypothetical protein